MRAALYARVSSDKQDVDLSISAQLRALGEYAQRNGYEVVRQYVDEAESGRTADRPQFQRMIAEARKPSRPFEILLVWKYSRFGRSREDAIVFKSLLKKHGVRVVSITEPVEDTPTGKLLEAIIESLDEFYSANLAQEVLRGMREAASRGFFVASQAPYGYRRIHVPDGKKQRPRLEPDPATAPTVTRMFHRVLEGAGLKGVVRVLDQEGTVGPKGKPWTKSTVHRILTNEAYTGTLVWGTAVRGLDAPGPVRVEGAWHPLVDADTFKKVQEMLKGRAFVRSHPRRTASPHLLSGLLRCGSCGRSFSGQEAKSGQYTYYVCSTLLKRGRGTCDAPYLNAQLLEELVVGKIREQVLTEENLKELVRLVNEHMDAATSEYRERLQVVEAEVEDANRRLERLYDVLETGKLGLSDLYPRIQHLRHRQDQLQGARAELRGLLEERHIQLADLSQITRYVDDMQTLLMESAIAERRAFVKSFVREIVVRGREAVLCYTLPLPEERLLGSRGGLDEDPGEVLAIVNAGTPGATRTPDQRFRNSPRRVRGHPAGSAHKVTDGARVRKHPPPEDV